MMKVEELPVLAMTAHRHFVVAGYGRSENGAASA
jgi:hypothetical protein